MGEAPSVTNFGERWPLADLALPSRYFGLLVGGEIGSGAEGSQFVEGRHLSPILGESGLQPIVCCQPARSGEGCFLAVSPGLFSGCVARVVFWLCRQGCSWLCRQVCPLTVLSGIFFSGFGSWLSWRYDQGIVQGSDY